MSFDIEITAGRWNKVTRTGNIFDLGETDASVINRQILDIAQGTNLLVGGMPKAIVNLLIERKKATGQDMTDSDVAYYRRAFGQRAPAAEKLFPATAKVAEKK